MFMKCRKLSSFDIDLPKLTNGFNMFSYCYKLTAFDVDLPKLTESYYMFQGCSALTSFDADLSSLSVARCMFYDCRGLVSFNSNLSKLTDGDGMFGGCSLDTASLKNIADTINTPSKKASITIGINSITPSSYDKQHLNAIAAKNWNVYVNGSAYTPSSTSSVMTLGEDGSEIETPIPYYAKPVNSNENDAQYVDAEGNYYNILGAQFIYGDDLSTYGMFTCLDDAAANMRLTKIVN